MATTLENLISQLENFQHYTPLTQEEIQKQASQRYQSVYDQKRLNARQTYETDDAALARELSGLQKSYDAQRQSAAAQNRNTYSQADRHSLSRGMQRSSFNEGTLANIDLAGDAAQRAIDQEQAGKEADIGQQRTLLSAQLGRTINQLNTDQLHDELAYADELTAREHDRLVENQNAYTQLAMQLYEYQHQLEQEAAEQARWQAEFNAKYGGGGSSGGGRRSKGTASSTNGSSSSVSGARRNQYDSMK